MVPIKAIDKHDSLAGGLSVQERGAATRGGNDSKASKDVPAEIGSSHGQNLALTIFCVPNRSCRIEGGHKALQRDQNAFFAGPCFVLELWLCLARVSKSGGHKALQRDQNACLQVLALYWSSGFAWRTCPNQGAIRLYSGTKSPFCRSLVCTGALALTHVSKSQGGSR
jgi:hypothetical protein